MWLLVFFWRGSVSNDPKHSNDFLNMARRRSAKKKKSITSSKSLSPATVRLSVGCAVPVLAVLAVVQFMSPDKENVVLKPESFNIESYRRDGSRFATPGNTYVIQAKVENIDTRGNDKIITVSLPHQKGDRDDRLPLLMKKSIANDINVTRGDTFLFEITCLNGQSAQGEAVKGMLLVNRVQSVQ